MSPPQGQTPASFCSNNRSQNRFKDRGHSADRPWTASSRDPHGRQTEAQREQVRGGSGCNRALPCTCHTDGPRPLP